MDGMEAELLLYACNSLKRGERMRILILTAAVLMAATGAEAVEWLYAIDGDYLYDVDPSDGDWNSLSSSWTGTELMTSCQGYLFAIQGDDLYLVDPDDGAWESLSSTWEGANALTASTHVRMA